MLHAVAWRDAVSAQADAPGPGAYETLGLDLADTANAFSFAKSVRYSAAGAHPPWLLENCGPVPWLWSTAAA